jgi:hypothetical protein
MLTALVSLALTGFYCSNQTQRCRPAFLCQNSRYANNGCFAGTFRFGFQRGIAAAMPNRAKATRSIRPHITAENKENR